ncbi:MAG: acyl-CoA/acyl-ACP dehydrogenase [Porticoccaceae bacterium]|jgi:alkylation response protein AidB-like acyl-CoA dehydrogenase|nr:acyl-CoA/acyl-ACP dehydrogenase [Alphaproteobacteria bacterium]MDP4746074.1 acyl-CoA/acyl-ACP dehydrogenase [Porticoccaceae bacterium]MDP4751811.1 acyl-CoA/acyl-ACP dehydrogenase [Porticoccaceae bacterium]MDP4889133.1 acyl-CoA/acyl-ACP dehydrogenase [Porticoccaceae bacterium]
MNFTFNDDQLLFRDTVRDLLTHEVTAERIRQRWDSATGIDSAALKSMVDLGLTAALVPEAQGGLGLNAVDFILLAEECGRAALPEPIVDSCLVATPMLVDADRALDGGNSCLLELLEGIAAGEQTVLCGTSINPYINYAHCADYLLLPHGNEVHLVAVKDVELERQTSVDLSRRLSKVNWIPRSETCIASGEMGADLWRSSLNRGALGNAAQLLGLTEAMVARSVQFATDREQFGRPIGVNQAVKHLLADCAVKAEFAKPAIYRAAYTVAVAPTRADWSVSHAKASAGDAANTASRNCTQVHGAMGYTWECDLHIWMKRAWTLDREWGDAGFHKNRIHEWLLQPKALLGPEYTFGRRHMGDATYSTVAP